MEVISISLSFLLSCYEIGSEKARRIRHPIHGGCQDGVQKTCQEVCVMQESFVTEALGGH